jgi:hypothetical protein
MKKVLASPNTTQAPLATLTFRIYQPTYSNMRKLLLLLFTFFLPLLLAAGGGMWLPLLLENLNEEEMKGMGMKITAEDIYSINQGHRPLWRLLYRRGHQ